jgi:alpha-D-ribose 1-methylphosphonate 5-triphosphate synthase subunit PhnH
MWALSYPGQVGELPVTANTRDACVLIGQALLDLEATFFTPDSALAAQLIRTGARRAAVEQAAYHFYPEAYYFHPELAELDLPGANLAYLDQAPVGTLLYPDRAATIIVACELGHGLPLTLSGPGIPTTAVVRVAGLPPTFWVLRAAKISYPLGIDLFLVDGPQMLGLPRTTVVATVETGN